MSAREEALRSATILCVTGDVVAAFGAHLDRQGYAANTVRIRMSMLNCLRRDTGADLLDLDGDTVAGWVTGHRTPESRRQAATSVRVFCDWADAQGLLRADPRPSIPKVRVPRHLPHPAPQEAVDRLLQLPDPYDVAAVLLGAFAGLRVAEIAACQPEDVVRTGSGMRVHVVGKGGRERWAPIPSWAADEVLRWLPIPRGVDYLGERLGRAVKRCGGHGGAHDLRHYYATTLLRGCHDLRLVQEALGHASPATTAIYTLVDSDAATAAVEAMPRPRLRVVA